MSRDKPCDRCEVNVRQAIDDGEVTCYQTCPQWQKWAKEREGLE